jgi:regulator of replication initiation timing
MDQLSYDELLSLVITLVQENKEQAEEIDRLEQTISCANERISNLKKRVDAAYLENTIAAVNHSVALRELVKARLATAITEN